MCRPIRRLSPSTFLHRYVVVNTSFQPADEVGAPVHVVTTPGPVGS
jgi:hypothetical protein